jgi:hypothetical protein
VAGGGEGRGRGERGGCHTDRGRGALTGGVGYYTDWVSVGGGGEGGVSH